MGSHIEIYKFQFTPYIRIKQFSDTITTDFIWLFYTKECKITDEETFFYLKLSDDNFLYPTSYAIYEEQDNGEMKLTEQKSIE